MNKLFVTPYTFRQSEKHLTKISKKPELTEPDLNLSVREILLKFTHGNLPDIRHDTLTDEKVTFEDYQDYMDKDYDLADMTRDKIRLLELKDSVEIAIKAKQEQKNQIKKAEEKAFEDYKKQKKEEQQNEEPPKKE